MLEADSAGIWQRKPAPVFTSLAVGGVHGCALTEAGALYCWGENNHAQVGVPRDSFEDDIVRVPTRVSDTPKSIKAISLGDQFSLLLTQDGSAYAFGDNSYGELGSGILGGESPTPVQVAITAVRELAPGAAHACAEKEDGTIWCWGYGASGALGGNGTVSDGQQTWVATPSLVPLTTVTYVATSNSATCAVTTDSVLWCWGENADGQLGGGSTLSTVTPTPEPTRTSFSCD